LKEHLKTQTKIIKEFDKKYDIDIASMSVPAVKQTLTTWDYLRLHDAIKFGIDHNDIETCIDCGKTINDCKQKSGMGYKCWI
tara:strand:+ start:6848 stop:7093 length:246 start_codon:yes stop_codon:yes gene_type:complete